MPIPCTHGMGMRLIIMVLHLQIIDSECLPIVGTLCLGKMSGGTFFLWHCYKIGVLIQARNVLIVPCKPVSFPGPIPPSIPSSSLGTRLYMRRESAQQHFLMAVTNYIKNSCMQTHKNSKSNPKQNLYMCACVYSFKLQTISVGGDLATAASSSSSGTSSWQPVRASMS